MKLKTFIDRPILSCAISVLILILGVIGLSNLPMEQYPDIAPPTIMVHLYGCQCGNSTEECHRSVGRSH